MSLNKRYINTKEYKLFVGNVPYDCTEKEFSECFKDIEGFKKADLIINKTTNISRGFGFITIQNKKLSEAIKNKSIIFKNRELRFSEYQNNITKIKYNKNYAYISNIPKGNNREWLKNCFKDYEPIGRYLIIMDRDTGEYKTSGIIEILDSIKYKNLLSKKFITVENNIDLKIAKYKILMYNNY